MVSEVVPGSGFVTRLLPSCTDSEYPNMPVVLSTRAMTTALAATSDSSSYAATMARPIVAVDWSMRANARSSMARWFHRLA